MRAERRRGSPGSLPGMRRRDRSLCERARAECVIKEAGRFIYSCILGKREIYEQPGNNVLVTAYFMTGYERTDDVDVTRRAAVPGVTE